MAITKARIEITEGESLTVGTRSIVKDRPIIVTDRAEIAFWEAQRPRVTVTALERTGRDRPRKVVQQDESAESLAAQIAELQRKLAVAKAGPPAKSGKVPDPPAGASSKDHPSAPNKIPDPPQIPEPDAPTFLPWSASSKLAELVAACKSRDIAVAPGDTVNILIAQLSDFDAESEEADPDEDEGEEVDD